MDNRPIGVFDSGLPVPQLIDRLIALAVERTEKQHG